MSEDKKVYKANEPITIQGEVVNRGADNLSNLNLVIKAENTNIYTQTFNLDAGQRVIHLATNNTATNSFN